MKDDPSQPIRARTVRLQVPLSSDEMKALDDFRFEQRMPSRAATVREFDAPRSSGSRKDRQAAPTLS
jgi:hypothetical protein